MKLILEDLPIILSRHFISTMTTTTLALLSRTLALSLEPSTTFGYRSMPTKRLPMKNSLLALFTTFGSMNTNIQINLCWRDLKGCLLGILGFLSKNLGGSVCVYFIPFGYKIAFSLGLYIGCIYIFGLKIIFFSLY